MDRYITEAWEFVEDFVRQSWRKAITSVMIGENALRTGLESGKPYYSYTFNSERNGPSEFALCLPAAHSNARQRCLRKNNRAPPTWKRIHGIMRAVGRQARSRTVLEFLKDEVNHYQLAIVELEEENGRGPDDWKMEWSEESADEICLSIADHPRTSQRHLYNFR